MSADDEERARDYTVGAKRPPVQHRFKPGRSGNPKGSRNLSTRISEELRKPVTVMKGGKPVKMTKGDVIANQLVDNSMKNNLKAIVLVSKLEQQDCRQLVKVGGDPSSSGPPPEKPQKVCGRDHARLRARHARQNVSEDVRYNGQGN